MYFYYIAHHFIFFFKKQNPGLLFAGISVLDLWSLYSNKQPQGLFCL